MTDYSNDIGAVPRELISSALGQLCEMHYIYKNEILLCSLVWDYEASFIQFQSIHIHTYTMKLFTNYEIMKL